MIAKLIAEFGENGTLERELGYDEADRLVHRWPEGESLASHGIMDFAKVAESAADDIPSDQFEVPWKAAIEEEAFFAEHDPFGDRFGTSIPKWECFLALVLISTTAYIIIS
jgi:hypothetical protein